MKFEVTSDHRPDTKMYEGMIITYYVSPLLGIKMNWMTEITHIKDGQYFVDEQRIGPYALWHHEHHFKEIPGGVPMNDILNYAIPVGVSGRSAHTVLVGKQIKKIFDFREEAIKKMFGEMR